MGRQLSRAAWWFAFAILLVLKLDGRMNWPWYCVLATLWLPVVIAVPIAAGHLIWFAIKAQWRK